MLGEKLMSVLCCVFTVCKTVSGEVKSGSELSCCFLQLQMTGKGPDMQGPAVLRVCSVEVKRFWLIPKIKPDPVFLAISLMRTLPADGKVELIHILPLDTVTVRLSKLERGNRKKSQLSARKPPRLCFSKECTSKDQTSEGQLPATGFLEDGIPYIDCKRALDIS